MEIEKQTQNPPKIRYIALLGATVLGIGAVFYHLVEGWSWIDAVYFSVVTLSTVGYGDLTPSTDAGKIFTSLYIIVGIGVFAAVINYVVKRAAVKRIQARMKRQEAKESKSI